MLIKNVQELAKEEREESEAKLREAIEILEKATSAVAGSCETSGGRFFRSTDISFWIKVRSRVASVGGNQCRCFRLFLFLIACAKRMGSIAARTRL